MEDLSKLQNVYPNGIDVSACAQDLNPPKVDPSLLVNTVCFSKLSDPYEFPYVPSLWVGHPAIARWLERHPRIAYYLLKLFRRI